jgi:Caspase recruitment domain
LLCSVLSVLASSAHLKTLLSRYDEVAISIRVRPIVAVMFESNALTFGELDSIHRCRSETSAARRLLNIIKKQPRQVYDCFLNALKETTHGDIYLSLIDVGKNFLGLLLSLGRECCARYRMPSIDKLIN